MEHVILLGLLCESPRTYCRSQSRIGAKLILTIAINICNNYITTIIHIPITLAQCLSTSQHKFPVEARFQDFPLFKNVQKFQNQL